MYARSSYLGRLATVVIGLLLAGASISAELFSDVDAETLQRLLVENKSTIAKYAHQSKRLRLVTINTNLLLGDDASLTISPFPDVSLQLERYAIEYPRGDQSFRWSGRFVNPVVSAEEFARQQRGLNTSEERIERMYSRLFELQIHGAKYFRDPASGEVREISAVRVDEQSGKYDLSRITAKNAANESTFYEVIFDIRLTAPIGTVGPDGTPFVAIYSVRSLPSDRQYHVVLEVDPNMAVPIGEFDRAAYPDASRRLDEYRRLEESLNQ